MAALDLLVLDEPDNLALLGRALSRLRARPVVDGVTRFGLAVDEVVTPEGESQPFTSPHGGLSVARRSRLPPARRVRCGDTLLPVAPWEEVVAGDAWVATLLDRARERARAPAAEARLA